MTPYELINLQRGIGDLEGIIKLQKINPTAFTPFENWVIHHLKIKREIEKRQQEIELQKEIDRVANEVVKEIEKKLK